MSFLKKIFSSAYDELWKAIIRPNRDKYNDIELGPEKFPIKGKYFKRTDFTLTNKKNNKLVCSFWEPFDEEREYSKLPCVIYLHGNSSSRCEVVPEVKYLLKKGITVFAFDFTGCGWSDGEYISLGWHEQEDVACVVEFLRRSNKVSTIGLWGRSMGAVTALMYAAKDLSIAGLVLDSPFSSLKNLINELAKDRVGLPDFIVRQAIKWIKETIKEKADFNLDDVEPKDYAEKCFIPAYFCHSKNDTFVNIHHCKDLYNLYAGDKSIVYVKGNHNSERSIIFKDSVALFFYKALRCHENEQEYELNKLYNNLELHFDDNNFCKNVVKFKDKKDKIGKKNINNSMCEIKISSKSDTKIKNTETNITNKDNSDNNIIFNDDEAFCNNDDNIFIHDINEYPDVKTKKNYNKYFNENSKYIQNKKLISKLNKTPLNNNNKTSEIENKMKSENKYNFHLSQDDINEIYINSPNKINNNKSSSIKKYNNSKISLIKLQKKYKNDNYNKTLHDSIPLAKNQKYSLLLKDNFNNSNNKNRTINQSNILYTEKIHHVKDLRQRRTILLEKMRNKFNKNKNDLNIKIINDTEKSKPFNIKYQKAASNEMSFQDLMFQIKNNGNKKNTFNNNHNNNRIQYLRYNIKNSIKAKINKEKEEQKNININNEIKNKYNADKNQIKQNIIKYINKKEENSKEEDPEKTLRNPENKLNSSYFFKENEDDFFLEEDNIKINIPHS